jgi:hypothetical protein
VTLIHELEREENGLVGDVVPHACELGLPCKIKKFNLNRPFLAIIETA